MKEGSARASHEEKLSRFQRWGKETGYTASVLKKEEFLSFE